jgi:hypothetical protein
MTRLVGSEMCIRDRSITGVGQLGVRAIPDTDD